MDRAALPEGTKAQLGGWDFRFHRGPSSVCVVLVHEVFGFDDYSNTVATNLSKNGFSTIAVDLYQGQHASTLEEAFKLRQSLTEPQVLNCLSSGAQFLRTKLGAGFKVGTMGFCVGGGYALLGACSLDLEFCVDYYGSIENVDKAKGLRGPVLMMLGSEDERVTPWAFAQFLPAAMKYKKRVDLQLYPNAKHAFHRPNWEGHNAEAAADAWAKTLAFLSQFKT